ncbi:MAG: CBS domain-containing protein [Burkholderiaceae bacterium]
MFSIYGPTGREFKGTLEQMRRVSQVHAADRARAIEPTARDGHDSALREAVEFGAPLTATTAAPTPHRAAAAAYAASQQPVHHAWHELLVSEVMHAPVLTVRADGRVDDALRQMALQGRGQAPVVNAQGILVGMVTRAELLGFVQWGEADTAAQAWAAWRAQDVQSVMLTPIPSVSRGADMRRVARALLDSGLPGLPVVSDEGQVSGFVSRTDVLRVALKDAGLDVWG